MDDALEAVIEVAASREAVWRAVSEPERVEQWMGCLGFRSAPGSTFYMQPDAARREAGDPSGAIVCRIQSVDPPRRLAFSWAFPDNPETWVEIRLRRIPGGTHVKITHTGWDQFDPEETRRIREGLWRGWYGVALPALRRVAEDSAA
jgi:uncharacterized protein YndB with AHSA1/START domain